jgi:hypothetical protein
VNPLDRVSYHWTPNRPQRVYDDPNLVWAEWLEGKYLDNTGYTNYKKNWTRPVQVFYTSYFEELHTQENDRWQTKRH